MKHWEKPFIDLMTEGEDAPDYLWNRADRQAQRMCEGLHRGDVIHLTIIPTGGSAISWTFTQRYQHPRPQLLSEISETWLAAC